MQLTPGTFFSVVTIALAIVLIWGFIRTRNYGYLVVMLPLTLWHLIWSGFEFIAVQASNGDSYLRFLSEYRMLLEFLRSLVLLLGFYLLVRRTPRPEDDDKTKTPSSNQNVDAPG
jgi:hypothetical protein